MLHDGLMAAVGSTGRTLAVLWFTGVMGLPGWAGTIPATDPPLPTGAGPVWTVASAWTTRSATRERFCINGLWRFRSHVPGNGNTPPSDDAWGFCKVPGNPKSPEMITYWHVRDPLKGRGAALTNAWYERDVTVPVTWTGRRVVVGFDRVSTELTLFCNGERVGVVGWFGGELDVTKWIKPGGTLRLTALVRGLAPGEVSDLFNEEGLKSYKRRPPSCSIVGDVWLDALPAAGPRVGPFLITTRVRGMAIAVHTELEVDSHAGAAGDLTLCCQVRDGDRVVKEFAVPVPEGAAKVDARAEWPEAELWDIGKPRLYSMMVSLKRGGIVLDQSLPERFGFREFEIRGKFFYLNGVKINLRPCSYHIAQLYTLAPACVNRWFDRIIAEGRNFVYTETVDSPNWYEAIQPVLRTADEKGILMAVTPMQINRFWERLGEPGVRSTYAQCLRTRAQRVWNHPALVLYRMNMNFDTYAQDQNPLVLSGEQTAPPDTVLGRKGAAAVTSSAIMNSIDPSRRTYHHACGNIGDLYTLNNYLCWPNAQDLREWLHVWADRGIKPLMMAEFDLPYPGSFQMTDPVNLWSNEPLMTEYGAILLGERSYVLEDDDFIDFTEVAWNRKTNAWGSCYAYFCSAVAPISDECASMYYAAVLPAWRTWGIPGGLNAWEYSTMRAKKRAARPSLSGMRVRPPELPQPTDWDHLQQPGFSPDMFIYDVRGNGHINSYMFPGAPYESEYLESTKWGKVLPDLLRPLYAYIAGPGADWPEQDHAYYGGESVRKSVIAINDLRQAGMFRVRWTALLNGAPVGSGAGNVTVAPAETGWIPVEFKVPAVSTRTVGEIRADVTVDGVTIPVAPFAFQVHPKAELPLAPAGWAIHDPRGRTSAALAAAGVALPAVEPGAPLPDTVKVLVIGSEALGVGGQPQVLRDLHARIRAGLQVLFFEQTPEALKSGFGLRALTRASRQVWVRDAAHPFIRTLGNTDLADWRGRSTLSPPETRPPVDLTESQRWKGVWRCSQRGTVASVLVEKPHAGSFHPIIDGEFDLRYMALWEVFEGQGHMVFCQMDVSDRLGKDPAADVLVANIITAMKAWVPAKPVPVALVGSEEALRGYDYLKLDAALNPEVPPEAGTLLVLGQGAGPWLARNRAAVQTFFANGGRAVAVGLDRDEAGALAHATGGALVPEAKTCSATTLPSPVPEVFRGVGPAEVHWRERKSVVAVTSTKTDGWRTPDGMLARVPVGTGEIVWIAAAPSAFDPKRRPDLIFTRVNVSRLLDLVLVNAGVRGGVTWTGGFQETEAKPSPAGHYVDRRVPRDDPYAYMRW